MAFRTEVRQLLDLAEGLRDSAIGQTIEDPATGEDADTLDEKKMDDAADVEVVANTLAKGDASSARELALEVLKTPVIERIKAAAPAAYDLLFVKTD